MPRRLRCRRPVGSGHADDFSGELTLQRRYDTLATLFFLAIYRRISFSYSGALPYGDRIQLSVTLLLRQTVKGIPSLEDENTLHYFYFFQKQSAQAWLSRYSRNITTKLGYSRDMSCVLRNMLL